MMEHKMIAAILLAASPLAGAADSGKVSAGQVYKRVWLEGAIGSGSFIGDDGAISQNIGGFNLHIRKGRHGAVLSYQSFSEGHGLASFTEVDAQTNQSINTQLQETSLAYEVHKPRKLGYFTYSIGLGVLSGVAAENCVVEAEDPREYSIVTVKICDKNDFSTVSVPLRATMGFGKYVGIAITGELNLNAEYPFTSFKISLPIGGFAK